METDDRLAEQSAAAARTRGFEAEVVDGTVQITLGRRRPRAQAVDTAKTVSSVLAPDGEPVGTQRRLIRPSPSELGAVLQTRSRR